MGQRWVWAGVAGLALITAAGEAGRVKSAQPVIRTRPEAATPTQAAPAHSPIAAKFAKPTAKASGAEAATLNPAAGGQQTLSTRVVAYVIDAKLDPKAHKITASETLTYKNLTGQPQQDFPFHLYLNAFQPQSSFMREDRRDNLAYEWKPEHEGSSTVKSLQVAGTDLTSQVQFIHPDDDNADDRTVMQVHLPQAIPPGGTVEFKINFEDQLPEVVARTGYLRNFFMVGQWFPKVGVWWKNAWNCHQFHHNTEFFADFGTFDVKLTVPQNAVLGAGGDEVANTSNADGTKTVTYHSEDVHDFSWTASPSFHLVEDSWTGSASTVKIHLLMSPGHDGSAQRYLNAVKGTLRLFDEWYGPYPYDRITMVDPPHDGAQAGGMEYPTLITLDTGRLMPEGVLVPEVVTEHEFGHQYWYGMVATNEFEEAWLDEGINSYTEVKIMDALYGKDGSVLNFPWGKMSEDAQQRLFYLGVRTYDPITRFAWQFANGSSYGGNTYGKTASVLLTLEKIIGEDTLRRAIHTYFMRYHFTHPTGEDFLKTIEEVSGQNLRWYFDQAVYGTAALDYGVEDVQSDPVNWYEKDAGSKSKKSDATAYRSMVLVHRNGDFVFPVDLEVKFDNGEVVHERWDGRDRWTRFTYVKNAKIVSAQVDPGNQINLDYNPFNNSYTAKADTHATRKLSDLWSFVTEWAMQLIAWLA
jgi:Peptidase family M1 domain